MKIARNSCCRSVYMPESVGVGHDCGRDNIWRDLYFAPLIIWHVLCSDHGLIPRELDMGDFTLNGFTEEANIGVSHGRVNKAINYGF